MKNYEKYAAALREKIEEDEGKYFCIKFIKPYVLKTDSCDGMDCNACRMLQMIWLLEEYEEREIDWSKVKVDTPILVRDYEDAEWDNRRHFAKYENGVVYTWAGGGTSWTSGGHMTSWKYAKLAEGEKGGAR